MENNVKLIVDGDSFILLESYSRRINNFSITVPKNFKTDLASIPAPARVFFKTFGKYTNAAVVHDFLYSELNATGINRVLADKIFLHLMREDGVSKVSSSLMYRAVRSFGELSWKKKIKNEGYIEQALIDKTIEAQKYYEQWNRILKLD